MRMSGDSTPGASANELWAGAPLQAMGPDVASTVLVLFDSVMLNAALWTVAGSLGPAGCDISTLKFAS